MDKKREDELRNEKPFKSVNKYANFFPRGNRSAAATRMMKALRRQAQVDLF